jgi:hypothetical protein
VFGPFELRSGGAIQFSALPHPYRRKVQRIWSRRALVALGFPLVVSADARVKSRCLAILVPVRTVASSASSMRALAWS